ncbi:MAG: hypothetical protein PUA83_07465 [Clostridiales bacterium]|nr:hypothetical protein [Clostridiales bacterium]
MKKTRLLALLLALCMVAALFAACGNTEPDETTAATTTAADTTAADTTAADTTAADTTVPENKLDLGGRTFTIRDNASNTMQIYPKDEFQSAYYDAWRDLWAEIEETYNFTFEKLDHCDFAQLMTYITAGDTDAIGDILVTKPLDWIPLATNGYIAALNSDECKANGLDIYDSKAFYQDFTQAMSVYNNIYAAQWVGDYNGASFGWCIYYNIDYVSQYGGVDSLYQVVRDMDWTWETFIDLQKKCTQDTDGDGTVDIWGSGEHAYGTEMFTIPGGDIVIYDEAQNKYVSNITSAAAQEALQFAQTQYNSGYCETSNGYGNIHRMFKSGEVAMVWGEKWNTSADDMLVNVDFNMGLVPLPKHESAETYANVLGGVPGTVLLKANSNFAQNCAMLQALGEAFTNEDWTGSYCEEELQGNEESLEMVLNYIWGEHGTTYLDLAWGNNDLLLNVFRNDIFFPVVTGKNSVSEVVQAQNATFQANIDEVFGQK